MRLLIDLNADPSGELFTGAVEGQLGPFTRAATFTDAPAESVVRTLQGFLSDMEDDMGEVTEPRNLDERALELLTKAASAIDLEDALAEEKAAEDAQAREDAVALTRTFANDNPVAAGDDPSPS